MNKVNPINKKDHIGHIWSLLVLWEEIICWNKPGMIPMGNETELRSENN